MSWDSDLLGLVRSTLVTTTAVKALVRHRVYEGELANVGKPIFPILTFRITDSSELQHVDSYRGIIRFQAWSKKAISEARNVVDTIRKPLNRQRISNSEINAVLSTSGTAFSTYDQNDHLWLMAVDYSFRAVATSPTIT